MKRLSDIKETGSKEASTTHEQLYVNVPSHMQEGMQLNIHTRDESDARYLFTPTLSLMYRRDELLAYIAVKKPDVIALTEIYCPKYIVFH